MIPHPDQRVRISPAGARLLFAMLGSGALRTGNHPDYTNGSIRQLWAYAGTEQQLQLCEQSVTRSRLRQRPREMVEEDLIESYSWDLLNDLFDGNLAQKVGKKVKRLAGIDVTRTVSMKRLPGGGRVAVTQFSWVDSKGRRRRLDGYNARHWPSAE
jgi:hypothetical protein